MSPERNDARVPDLVLERYRLGELPPPESERLERRLKEDGELRERLAALELSDREIRRRYPPSWLAERVRSRLAGGSQPAPRASAAWHRRWALPAAVAAAATVVFVLAPRLIAPPGLGGGASPAPEASGDRIKGLKPALALFRKTPEGSERLTPEDVVRAGDLLRVGYQAAGSRYGVILSIDGRGAVTLHLPAAEGPAAALQSGGPVLLDHAYELDDAPRFERFYFVTSQAPFDAGPVLEAARRAAPGGAEASPARLGLPPSLEQTVFSLRKGATP
jgi:anti-sigma factor RsiW